MRVTYEGTDYEVSMDLTTLTVEQGVAIVAAIGTNEYNAILDGSVKMSPRFLDAVVWVQLQAQGVQLPWDDMPELPWNAPIQVGLEL